MLLSWLYENRPTICRRLLAMMTSKYDRNILEWDVKQQTKKREDPLMTDSIHYVVERH